MRINPFVVLCEGCRTDDNLGFAQNLLPHVPPEESLVYIVARGFLMPFVESSE